jgi:hypothetical protein
MVTGFARSEHGPDLAKPGLITVKLTDVSRTREKLKYLLEKYAPGLGGGVATDIA